LMGSGNATEKRTRPHRPTCNLLWRSLGSKARGWFVGRRAAPCGHGGLAETHIAVAAVLGNRPTGGPQVAQLSLGQLGVGRLIAIGATPVERPANELGCRATIHGEDFRLQGEDCGLGIGSATQRRVFYPRAAARGCRTLCASGFGVVAARGVLAPVRPPQGGAPCPQPGAYHRQIALPRSPPSGG